MHSFLELLASGGYYRQVGTVIKYCHGSAKFFCAIASNYIRLPVHQELFDMSKTIVTQSGEKRIVLYIDGFVLKIQRPDHAGDA